MRAVVTLLTDGKSPANLSLAQAQSLQCYSCSEPGCCTYLRLHTFWIKHRRDLDFAHALLQLADFEVGISDRGEWSVFWRRACRHLSPTDDSCLVHGTDAQPEVCKRYPGENCWYARVLPARAANDYVRLDDARLRWIEERVSYGVDGHLTSFPRRADLISAFGAMQLESPPLPRGDVERPDAVEVAFPLAPPDSAQRLEFVRMALGYPGIGAVVTDKGWFLVARSEVRPSGSTSTRNLGLPSGQVLARYRFEEFETLALDVREKFFPADVENGTARPTP